MIIWILRSLAKLFYGFRVYNMDALKTPGPVLLIPNHVSWLDWLFVGTCLDEDWKFVVSSTSAETSWLHRKIMINRRTFPIDTLSPYAVKHMAEFLQQNGRLVLFAEGRLSRTGVLMKLFDGTGFLLHKTHAKVITCYLRNAFRLPFSPNREKKVWFPRVSAHFSDVITPPVLRDVSTAVARDRLTAWLRDQMLLHQFQTEMEFGPANLINAIVSTAKIHPDKVILQDIVGRLNYRRLLIGASLLADRFRGLLSPENMRVGVLLPNANAMPVCLLALWSLDRVPAILNYSTGAATMLLCAQVAGLKEIITSRTFTERAKLNLQPLTDAGIKFIYVDDVRKTISSRQKIASFLRSRLALGKMLQCRQQPDDTAVVLFTSGSEGAPKAVQLSQKNLLANIRQLLAVIDLQEFDRLFNALPLFHSFGLLGALMPLVRGFFAFLYPSPLHYRVIPNFIYLTDCTVMLGTNTFLSGYARRAHPMDFRTVRYLVAGAEKLQQHTIQTWSQQFGVRPLEGYGATECSPVISVNTPLAFKPGTAGRLLPGMNYRLEPAEGVSEGGRLHVRGPNVMKGYVNAEANTKFSKLCGWYDTGDIAKVDADGFVTILGRLKRFAKISGEMVSLTAVEEALSGAFPQYGRRFQIAVITRPDSDKGRCYRARLTYPDSESLF